MVFREEGAMTTTTVIDKGQCLKCGGETEIRRIESSPFPDDEQTKLIEVCQSCGFENEKSFISTNDTTSFDHQIKQEIIEGRVAEETKI
jgi:hypothetical protein